MTDLVEPQTKEGNRKEPVPLLTTLGLFVIDDNLYPGTSRPSEHDIIGGGASYAIIGARIIAGAKLGKQVSGIIDQGSDFPPNVERELKSWGTGMVFRMDPTRLTTRGANIYIDDIRHFEFRTPKKRVEVDDIKTDPWLLNSKAFHMCCTIERCEEIIDTINSLVDTPPTYVFEPFPGDCVPEHYEHLTRVLKKIDIFTPNLDEACALLGIAKVSKDQWSHVSSQFQKHQSIPNSGTLLRCGADGCFVHNVNNYQLALPAYHQDQDKVLDVTGGGNSFCGGFAVAFSLTQGDWLTAAICGNLASGCVVERLGIPTKHPEKEEWNGLSIEARAQVYQKLHGVEWNGLQWLDAHEKT